MRRSPVTRARDHLDQQSCFRVPVRRLGPTISHTLRSPMLQQTRKQVDEILALCRVPAIATVARHSPASARVMTSCAVEVYQLPLGFTLMFIGSWHMQSSGSLAGIQRYGESLIWLNHRRQAACAPAIPTSFGRVLPSSLVFHKSLVELLLRDSKTVL